MKTISRAPIKLKLMLVITTVSAIALMSACVTFIVNDMLQGNIDDARFSVFYLQNDTLIAVDSINDPKPFMAGKKILKRGVNVTRAQLEDPDVSLKDLASG